MVAGPGSVIGETCLVITQPIDHYKTLQTIAMTLKNVNKQPSKSDRLPLIDELSLITKALPSAMSHLQSVACSH